MGSGLGKKSSKSTSRQAMHHRNMDRRFGANNQRDSHESKRNFLRQI